MLSRKIILSLLVAGLSCVLEAKSASSHIPKLKVLLRELPKSAPATAVKLNRKTVRIRRKSLVKAIDTLLYSNITSVVPVLGAFLTKYAPLEVYEDELRALIAEAITIDAVAAVRVGFGFERFWYELWEGDLALYSPLASAPSDLMLAVERGSIKVARAILYSNHVIAMADINAMFIVAAQRNDVDMMKLLLKHGADDFEQAVEQAVAQKSVAALRLLAKYHDKQEIAAAIIRHRDHGDNAMQSVATEIKRELLSAEHDLSKSIATGAIIEEVEHMLAAGADVNSKGAMEDFPLALAALRGDWQLIVVLLDAGAEINARGKDGRTALHNALRIGHHEAAALLLKRGADPDGIDNFGNTPEILARELEDNTLLVLIRKAQQRD